MNKLLQFVGIILFGAISFYIPLQAYARRIQRHFNWLPSSKTRLKTIAIAYFVWYMPVVWAACGVLLSENRVPVYPSILLIVAILWVLIGYLFMEAGR